jgi:HD-like signal output (HDOD) protein
MKATVLFIDDDPFMLKALERIARMLRPEWQVLTCDNPKSWKTKFLDVQPNIVFCDYLMPGRKGDKVLAECRTLLPNCLRVLLTGDLSEEIISDASRDAHFVLSKPFQNADIDSVFVALTRLLSFNLPDELRTLLTSGLRLPSLPQIAKKVRSKIRQPEVNIHELAVVISQDSVISARLVQLANSAFLGFKHPTHSLAVCLMRLGTSLVEVIVTAMALESQLPNHAHYRAANEKAFQQATISQVLSDVQGLSHDDREKIFTAAILSGLGRLAALALKDQNIALPNLMFGLKIEALLSWYLLTSWGYEEDIIQLILDSANDNYLHQDESALVLALSGYLVDGISHEYFMSLIDKLPNDALKKALKEWPK